MAAVRKNDSKFPNWIPMNRSSQNPCYHQTATIVRPQDTRQMAWLDCQCKSVLLAIIVVSFGGFFSLLAGPELNAQEAESAINAEPNTETQSTFSDLVAPKGEGSLRIATYNVSLNRAAEGKLASDLEGGDKQAQAIAAVIRAVRPDILLLNEVDYSIDSNNGENFVRKYVESSKQDALGGNAWKMPYTYSAPVNTGVPSKMDLNQNEKTNDPEDAWGYGRFPGQYGMAVGSRYAFEPNKIRTLQKFRWSKLPNALRPQAPDAEPYYDDATWSQLRLSSKSFWDVPIQTPFGVLHVLASHPTPPAFDGPEDRNGCRNHDEIKLIEYYIEGQDFLVGDNGERAGLEPADAFVVLGDLNSDPFDGGSRGNAISDLLSHSRIAKHEAPRSVGAASASKSQGGANERHRGPAENDTGDFNDRSVGNLRIDYVLPSHQFRVIASGVFWPELDALPAQLREPVQDCLDASDHHLVWVDVMPAN